MIENIPAIPSVLMASLVWTAATQIFARMGKRINITRLNFFKTLISLAFFLLFNLLFGTFKVEAPALSWLFASGVIGFGLADLLIFYSFAQMGAARTLMISAFSPLLLAIQSYLFLGISMNMSQLFGLICMFLCIFFLSLDKLDGVNFNWKISFFALIGYALDAMGVTFTKKAFLLSPELTSATANMYRIIAALLILFVVAKFKKVSITDNRFTRRDYSLLVLSSFLGTFLSVLFWVNAISKGHPPTIAALGSLSPVYATIIEYWLIRRTPSRYFILALMSMGGGIYFLL
jgi:drug/metabolite transporter (DMT)-like permease